MEIESILFIVAVIVLFVYSVYKEIKTKDDYCSCNCDDNYLYINGRCRCCGKPDGDWYP